MNGRKHIADIVVIIAILISKLPKQTINAAKSGDRFCRCFTPYNKQLNCETMAKICFPHYKKGEFASLADALKFMERETYSISRYAFCEIVRYNI